MADRIAKSKSTIEKKGVKDDTTSARKARKLPEVVIPHALTVRQLSDLLGVTPIEVIKYLMRSGIMANINQVIGYEDAALIASMVHYGTYTIRQIKEFLADSGVKVRKTW